MGDTGFCVMCGEPLRKGEVLVCILHAGQVESATQTSQHTASLHSEKSKQTSSKLGKLSKQDVDSKKTSKPGPKSKKLQQIDPRDPTGRFAFEFEQIDKNRDGWLSRSELHQGLLDAGWHQDEVCGLFEQIDLDNDGHITKDEFISHRSRTVVRDPRDPTGYFAFEFERIDKNKDGVLSLSELHQGLLSSGWEQDEVSRLFELIDSNGDGSISKDEFIAFKSSSFI